MNKRVMLLLAALSVAAGSLPAMELKNNAEIPCPNPMPIDDHIQEIWFVDKDGLKYAMEMEKDKPTFPSQRQYFNQNLNNSSEEEYWLNIRMQNSHFLDLSWRELYRLPLEYWQVIASMEQLREIDLRYNNLNKLPLNCWQEIASMKQLQVLNLTGNLLNKLPLNCWQEIASIKQLREIDLKNNDLGKLPDSDPRIQLIRDMEKRGVKVSMG